MARAGLILLPLMLAAAFNAAAQGNGQSPMNRYSGYSWPVATGCTQRVETYPNFGNDVRTRKDGSKRAHLGIDIIPPPSDRAVYVAKDGVVVDSSPSRGSGWGNYVVVKHDDGLKTLYAHLEAPSTLTRGAVSKGDLIGKAGQTETFFVHVHFEIHSKEHVGGWQRGRLDPLSVVGELSACRNSASR